MATWGEETLAPTHLWEAFDRVAQEQADAPALVFVDRIDSFSALRNIAERAAGWLASMNVGIGDIVAIQLPKRRETFALWLACLRQGCPYVFIDPRNPPIRNTAILARLRPTLLVTTLETVNPHGLTFRIATSRGCPHRRWSRPPPTHTDLMLPMSCLLLVRLASQRAQLSRIKAC
jgi:acyl-CoA synthetase (AMP-forming)/AMP-acid ligase II